MDVEFLCRGQRIPEWATGTDGCVMDYHAASGLTLLYFLNTPTAEERAIFDQEKGFKISFTPVRGDKPFDFAEVGFFCFKIGQLEWSDCPFSPNLCAEVPVYPDLEPGCGYPLTVVLIDAATGEIQGLRVIGLGHEFSKHFRAWCSKLSTNRISPNIVHHTISEALVRYSTAELVERAWLKWEI